MPSGVVSVGVLADFAQLIEQSDAAGLSIEAFSGKVVTSSRQASRAMADFMKQNGASADEAKVAAAKTAAAWDATYGQLSKGARDAGQAALTTSRLYQESADQQTAAFAKVAAAQRDLEAQQKAAADAARAASAKMAAAAEASAARVTAAQKKLASAGKWALFGGVAGIAASVKGAADLQTQMERLHTQANVSQGAIQGLTNSVLKFAGPLATSPNALAQSLYHVESGGVHGADALKVMATAAKEAKVSGADLTDTTTALTATVYSGISGAQNYAKAMGILNATVGAGDMTFQDLNEALGGPMLATVKGYGLSLKDVGAAMATFGDLNIRGADAATQLRMAVQYMARPAATAGPILQKLGLSTTSFADAMSKGGLLPALQLLHDRLVAAKVPANDYAQVISDIFSKKGASGVTILENSLTKLESKYRILGASTNQVNQGWVGWNKTLAADMDHLKATVQALADKFGTFLLPKMESVAHAASDVISWFQKNKTAAEALGITIGTVLGGAIAVFVYGKVAAFVNGMRGMVTGIGQLVGAITPAPSETEALTTAIQQLTTAMTPVQAEADGAAQGIGAMGAAAGTAAPELDAAAGGARAVGGAAAAATPEVEALDTALGSGGLLGTVGALAEKMGPLAAAFAAFEAIKQTPGVGNIVSSFTNPNPGNQFPTPKHGETERRYLAQMNGLPSYSGPLTVAGVEKARANAGMPAEKSLIEQLFKQINEQGHFGHHGFVPRPVTKGTATSTPATGMVLSKSWQAAVQPASQLYGGATKLLTSGQQAFAAQLSHDTGMNPNMVAAWLLAEQSGSAAQYYQKENNNDWLNIGVTGAPGSQNFYKTNDALAWTNPVSGANATAAWLKGQTTLGGYGHAASTIQSALAQMPNASPAEQVKLLQGSGWASGGYPELASVYNEVLGAGGAKIWLGHGGRTGVYSQIPTAGISPPHSGGSPILRQIQNLGTGAKIPAAVQYAAEKSRATQLGDRAARAQAVGQAQNTVLQAINQQLQDRGAAVVQRLTNLQTRATDHAAAIVTAMKDATQKASDKSAALVTAMKARETQATNQSAATVAAMKDRQTQATDHSSALVTAMKDGQAVADQKSAIQVQAIKDQTTAIQDSSAVQVAAIQGMAQRIADASNAAATVISDNAQTNADTINERGLYGLNLVTQQLRVAADETKTYWDRQIATAQQQLDTDQMAANVANAQAQLTTDQVTATQTMNVLQAQQNSNLVTLKEDALVAKAQAHVDAVTLKQQGLEAKAQAHLDAVTLRQQGLEAKAQQHLDAVTAKQDSLVARSQQHLDTVTLRQDGLASAAKAHADAVTISQDSRILKATQHADSVQLSVDVTKIGPAQTAVDLSVGKDKTIQQEAQANLNLATAQGNVQVNQAQLALANVTASANETISGAQNAYQQVQNSANSAIQAASNQYSAAQGAANQAIQIAQGQYSAVTSAANQAIQKAQSQYSAVQDAANQAIQKAQGQYGAAQDTANQLIQQAVNAYQAAQDQANQAIASAQQSQAATAASWAAQIASAQAALSGTQGNAATAEAAAQGQVSNMQALASTQFAGSGLVINQYGVDLTNPASVSDAASWAIRSSGLATV